MYFILNTKTAGTVSSAVFVLKIDYLPQLNLASYKKDRIEEIPWIYQPG